jgi:hypothetical protein
MGTEVSRDANGVLFPKFDVLFQDFMKKKNLVFVRHPLDGSNKQIRNVHFDIVLPIFEEKNMTLQQRSLCHGAFTLFDGVRIRCLKAFIVRLGERMKMNQDKTLV